MVFNAVFNIISFILVSYPCFLGVCLTCAPHVTFPPNHQLLFHITTADTMTSSEGELIAVAMTIIKAWKEIGRLGHRTSDPLFFQVLHATDSAKALGECISVLINPQCGR